MTAKEPNLADLFSARERLLNADIPADALSPDQVTLLLDLVESRIATFYGHQHIVRLRNQSLSLLDSLLQTANPTASPTRRANWAHDLINDPSPPEELLQVILLVRASFELGAPVVGSRQIRNIAKLERQDG